MCSDLLELEFLWIVWLIYILLSLFYCGLLNNIPGFCDYDGTELAHITRWRILNIFGYLFVFLVFCWAFLVAQMLKRLPAMQETWVQSLGREDPLEEEMATHSSILAWKIPWAGEPGGLQSMGSHTTDQLHFSLVYQSRNWHRIYTRNTFEHLLFWLIVRNAHYNHQRRFQNVNSPFQALEHLIHHVKLKPKLNLLCPQGWGWIKTIPQWSRNLLSAQGMQLAREQQFAQETGTYKFNLNIKGSISDWLEITGCFQEKVMS